MIEDPWVRHVRVRVKAGRGPGEHNLIGFIPPERLTRRGKNRIRLLRVLQLRLDALKESHHG